MKFKEDIKSIFRELSPIIAGFKLAIIVISWFGFGSVASWVISNWYPFTRRMWDHVANLLSIPSFPIVVKDSLTALVFFLPIGISALINRSSVNERNSLNTSLGAFFGIAFLFVICWDVLATLFDGIRATALNNTNPYLAELVLFIEGWLSFVSAYRFYIFIPMAVVYILAFLILISLYRRDIDKFTVAIGYLRGHAKVGSVIGSILITGLLLAWQISNFIFLTISAAPEILIATIVLLLIVIFLLAAIAFIPKKLFLATGAAIAFIFSAACFEAVIVLIAVVEGSA